MKRQSPMTPSISTWILLGLSPTPSAIYTPCDLETEEETQLQKQLKPAPNSITQLQNMASKIVTLIWGEVSPVIREEYKGWKAPHLLENKKPFLLYILFNKCGHLLGRKKPKKQKLLTGTATSRSLKINTVLVDKKALFSPSVKADMIIDYVPTSWLS